jgi:ubiquinone/menaquinone biosynthesis C-methylase UbiE
VLDLGCGTGQLTEPLAPILTPDGLYYGTDVAPEAVAFCRSRFPQSNFHFVTNEQSTIPIHGIEFDYIYLGSVFTHMLPTDTAAMLGDIHRLLAPRGSVVADAFVSPSIAHYTGSQAMIQLSESWLLAQFQAHSFRHREICSSAWNEANNCRRVTYRLGR